MIAAPARSLSMRPGRSLGDVASTEIYATVEALEEALPAATRQGRVALVGAEPAEAIAYWSRPTSGGVETNITVIGLLDLPPQETVEALELAEPASENEGTVATVIDELHMSNGAEWLPAVMSAAEVGPVVVAESDFVDAQPEPADEVALETAAPAASNEGGFALTTDARAWYSDGVAWRLMTWTYYTPVIPPEWLQTQEPA